MLLHHVDEKIIDIAHHDWLLHDSLGTSTWQMEVAKQNIVHFHRHTRFSRGVAA
jgi:hypothetical protein